MFPTTGSLPLVCDTLLSTLRIIGLILAAPFLLVLIVCALVVVLVDFTFFRLRSVFTGQPHPKGIWEF